MSGGFLGRFGLKTGLNPLRLGAGLTFLLLLAALPRPALAAGDEPTNSSPVRVESTANDETLRSYLRLQDQLHEVEQKLESTRKDSEQAAGRNAEMLAGRLAALEQALAPQRVRELELMQNSNRMMLVAAGVFAGVCFLAVMMMGYFQWRTVNRLAEITSLPGSHLLGPGALRALAGGEQGLVVPSTPDRSHLKLSAALQKLERRILELETVTHPEEPSRSAATAEAPASSRNGMNGGPAKSGDESAETRVPFLLGRGQAMLNMDKPEEALAAFEESLTLEPENAEALVKKGQALERLGRIGEALESYDQAITANASLTVAWLCKGGLYNRMDKHAEALECYEKALHGQR